MSGLSIAGVQVAQDDEGRFRLNDFHKASGGEKRHSPSYWLDTSQSSELVAELETTGFPVVTIEGRNGGTFVCKEMVYAYAMWISAKFNLHVIRTFDVSVPPVPKPVALPSYAEALRGLADQIEQTERANAQLAIAAPKAAFVDQYVEASGSMSFRQVAKLLNANERQFRQLLLDKGAMYYLGGVLTPYSQHQEAGRFEVKTGTSDTNGHAFSQARFTAKGVQWVAGLWASYLLEVAA